MKLALCGFEHAGKSTVFDALTGATLSPEEARSNRLQVVPVPDPRLERLRSDYNPKKYTPATVQYEDVPGFGGDKYFGELREADALICVVRGFENPSVLARQEKVDWQRDLKDIAEELCFADFALAEKHVERLRKATRHHSKGQSRDKDRLTLLERLLPVLEEGRPATDLEWTKDDLETIKDYGLLTLKPRIMLVNMGDDDTASALGLADIPEFEGDERPTEITCGIRARLEAEVAQLEDEERAEFLEDFGIQELFANRLIRISYQYLDLISFLTAGDKEVRAWTIRRGLTAAQAAGKIHSDFERAFIRAEVVAWSDYQEHGSVKACKEAKKWRLEGKAYVVQDGDVVEIRHGA